MSIQDAKTPETYPPHPQVRGEPGVTMSLVDGALTPYQLKASL